MALAQHPVLRLRIDPMTAKAKSFDLTLGIFSVVVLIISLFLPLVLIAIFATRLEISSSRGMGAVEVGIAVIIRMSARPLFRAGAANAFRTAFGTVSRSFVRTLTRRFVRFFLRAFFGVVTKQMVDDSDAAAPPEVTWSVKRSWFAVVLGFIVLAFSFLGVVTLLDFEPLRALLAEFQVSLFQACFIAGLPIIVYTLFLYAAARRMSVRIRFVTDLDAILLQAYFTGSGSFLPMSTDVDYEGTTKQKSWIATMGLLGLYAVHLILLVASTQLKIPVLQFASTMFLIYAFVYSFPINPLEGYDIWRHSKLHWVCAFLPIMLSFALSFPVTLNSII